MRAGVARRSRAPAVRPACRRAACRTFSTSSSRHRAPRNPRVAARCRFRAPGSGTHRSPLPCRGRRAGSAPASAARARAGPGRSCIRSLATRITVSGVRSSWLASRVKSRSRRTNARDALAHALQRAGELLGFDPGVGRQLVGAPARWCRISTRIPAADFAREPLQRRHHAPRHAIGEPRACSATASNASSIGTSDQLPRQPVDARLRVGQVQAQSPRWSCTSTSRSCTRAGPARRLRRGRRQRDRRAAIGNEIAVQRRAFGRRESTDRWRAAPSNARPRSPAIAARRPAMAIATAA